MGITIVVAAIVLFMVIKIINNSKKIDMTRNEFIESLNIEESWSRRMA